MYAMFEIPSISVLNSTQKALALEFAEDRIIPCLLNLFERAKDVAMQKALMDIILLSRYTTNKEDSDSFFETIDLDNLVVDLLKSLFALYQRSNETHIFIQPLLDERFYNHRIDFEAWKNYCKKELLNIYTDQIDSALDTHYPDLFKEIANTFNPIADSMYKNTCKI